MTQATYTLSHYTLDDEEVNDFTPRTWDDACDRARTISDDRNVEVVIVRDELNDIGMLVYRGGKAVPR